MCEDKKNAPETVVDYTTFPEGFEQLARDLDVATDDLEARKRMLIGLVNALKD